MSVVPAAPFLVDFGSKHLTAEIAEEMPHGDLAAAAEPERGEQIEEAYARGIEEGRRAAEAEAAAQLEETKAALVQTLASSRETWCREEGARIAERIGIAISEMEDRIAAAAERVLRPFMAEAVRERAIGELRAILNELIAGSSGITIEIAGPEDLLGAVRESLSASVATVSYIANDACDVQIKAGASILETRIAAWLKASEGQLT